jgi:hypothetical protein
MDVNKKLLFIGGIANLIASLIIVYFFITKGFKGGVISGE